MRPATGILFINLGTPNAPNRKSIKTYLREFLSDPRVIDIPALFRFFLVNGLIVPFRSSKTTHAYQAIWTPQGSPLLHLSQLLCDGVQKKLGANYHVALGMRYGQPGIAQALKSLQDKQCDPIIVLPLFPHYASATTGSALEVVFKLLSQETVVPTLKTINDFYAHPVFINSYSVLIKQSMQDFNADHTIFSYHGLPMRQVQKSEPKNISCVGNTPCPNITANNRYCYRAQCFTTSRLLAQSLGFADAQYSVAFQSRLGKLPWTGPYIDLLLPQLRAQGIKRLAIATPTFVVDCLETLEEIDIRLRAQWLALGGEAFHRVPCLNEHAIDAMTNIILEQ